MLAWSGGELALSNNATGRTTIFKDMFTVTDVISSSAAIASATQVVAPVTYAARTRTASVAAGAPYTDTTTDTTIATVNSNCTHVLGMMQVNVTDSSGTNTGEVSAGIWRQCNGTNYHSHIAWGTDVAFPTERRVTGNIALYTFFVSSGVLKLRERFLLRSMVANTTGLTVTQRAISIEFRLWCGFFN